MKFEYQESYEIIEDLCNVHLGVGDKFILKKIIQDAEEKGLEFLSNGGQYIIRKFSSFFLTSNNFDIVLRGFEESEKKALYRWSNYWEEHYKK